MQCKLGAKLDQRGKLNKSKRWKTDQYRGQANILSENGFAGR